MRFADNLTDVADILSSETENGEVRVKIGDYQREEGLAQFAGLWGVDGFVSVPNDPDADGAAQAIYLEDGHTLRAIASRDNRWASKTGSPAPGDRFIVSNCAARLLLKQAESSITLYTENQEDGDSTELVDLNGKKGRITIVCGGSLFQMTKDKIVISAGGHMLVLDSTGFHVYGAYADIATGGGNLGVIPPGIVPTKGVMAVIGGVSGMTGTPAPNWTVALV